MKARRLPIVLLAALACLASARAELLMSLSSSVQNSARGREIVFSGTLTNTSATDKVFLNDMIANLSGVSATQLVFEGNSFFANVPGILSPSEVYSDSELFRIALPASAPADDYGGSITLRGGADINANGDLASANFSVLSPAVSITANDNDASEFGPDNGTIIASRTGDTAIDLPVSFSISGSAINGVAYQAIAPGLTIPAGSSSAMVTITPIANNLAEGDRSVVLTLASSVSYNAGANVGDSVIIHDKPADAWRFAEFGANANDPAAADAADFDGDGVANLLEFALALDPKSGDVTGLPATGLTNGYLTLSYVPNPAAVDVNYIVEGSTDLANWSNGDVEPVTLIDPNPPGRQTFRYKFSVNQGSHAFLRLRVVRDDLTGAGK